MAWKIIEYTGNGYKVEVQSPHRVDGLEALPAILYLDPNIQTKAKARELLKSLPLNIETTVSHEPIFTPEIEKELQSHIRTYEEIKHSQRLVEAGEWYIDDFGFYVYCYSRVADYSQFKDLRYDNDV